MTASTPPTRPRWNLDKVGTLLLIVTCLVVTSFTVWDRFAPAKPAGRTRANTPPVPADPVSLQGATLRGDLKAEVVLIEFSDFECPYCAKFVNEVQPDIERLYVRPGRVKVAFRHLPLPIHRSAQKAAEAAECAGQQGRFWEMHDALFARQPDLSRSGLMQRASAIGLDATRFDVCLEGEATSKIKADLALAKALFVQGTPTFFVGIEQSGAMVKLVHRLEGAATLGNFRKALDNALAVRRPG